MSDATLKDSTYNSKNGRYVLGGVAETSSSAIEWWSMNPMPRDPSDIVYIMEAKYEGRPDLLGYLFYGDSGLWWVIGLYNGIVDPLEEFIAGKILFIPLKERVEGELFTKRRAIGGIASTRKK